MAVRVHAVIHRIAVHRVDVQFRRHDENSILFANRRTSRSAARPTDAGCFPTPARVGPLVVRLEARFPRIAGRCQSDGQVRTRSASRNAASSVSARANIRSRVVASIALGSSGFAPKQSLIPSRKNTTSGGSSPHASRTYRATSSLGRPLVCEHKRAGDFPGRRIGLRLEVRHEPVPGPSAVPFVGDPGRRPRWSMLPSIVHFGPPGSESRLARSLG